MVYGKWTGGDSGVYIQESFGFLNSGRAYFWLQSELAGAIIEQHAQGKYTRCRNEVSLSNVLPTIGLTMLSYRPYCRLAQQLFFRPAAPSLTS